MRRLALPLLPFVVACQGPIFDFGPNEPPLFVPPRDTERVFRPVLPATTIAEVAPPPISGGTLAVTADQKTVVASDPDRDIIALVDIASKGVVRTIALRPGDQPGRITEDKDGRIHVVLRGSRELATIDRTTGGMSRRSLCAQPRGVAYSADRDLLYVACAEGTLLMLSPSGGAPVGEAKLEPDLRDIAITRTGLWISKFRSTHVLMTDFDGNIIDRTAPQSVFEGVSTAWRMNQAGEDVVMIHQQVSPSAVTPSAGGYGGSGRGAQPCSPKIVQGAVAVMDGPSGLGQSVSLLPDAVVPVDFARSPAREVYAVAAPGSAHLFEISSLQVFEPDNGTSSDCPQVRHIRVPGGAAVVAVAFDVEGQLYAQTREPAEILFVDEWSGGIEARVAISETSREDTGHTVFHTLAGVAVACASCHPEGTDDGVVWRFEGFLERRTPSLLGTIEGTAPYHWDGEFEDIDALLADVYEGRMSGFPLVPDQAAAMRQWLGELEAPPVVAPANAAEAAAIARGEELFNGVAGCATCHGGAKLTNNSFADVGSGGVFQVPSLIGVRWRAPFMHNGCATTLLDRFGYCGGDRHGDTATLRPMELEDLVAYLGSL